MNTCTQATFAETQAERLFTVEQQLRSAVQAVERQPQDGHTLTIGLRGHVPPRAVALSPADARTLLRAILPACMALGRTRRATLRLHAALGSFHAAILGITDPSLTGPAIAAALDLAAELGDWIDEAQWREATRKASANWPRRVSRTSLTQQSSGAEGERPENTAPPPIAAGPAPKRRRRGDQVPGQAPLLLPLVFAKREADTADIAATPLRKSA